MNVICVEPLYEEQRVRTHSDNIFHAVFMGPANESFVSERSGILQQSGETATIREFKDLSVLIENRYSYPILGYVISWRAGNTTDGELFTKVFWHRTDLRAGQVSSDEDLNRLRIIYYAHAVPVHASRLISPFFNVSKLSDVNAFGDGSVFHGPSDFRQALLRADVVEVKLDSVVYADGLFEGKDELGFFDRVNGEIAGIRDVEQYVKSAKEEAASSNRVFNFMQQWSGTLSKNEFPAPGSSMLEWRAFSRKEFVSDIMRIYRLKGFEAAETAALAFDRYKVQIHR